MATPIDAWKVGLANYFKSEEHSDCTITCGPCQFKVHKFAIGVHSEYFRTALKANTFRICFGNSAQYRHESLTDQQQEGETGTIELKAIDPDSDNPEDACDDPEIVKLMVGYFYHLDYLHDDNAVAPPAVVEIQDSPAPPPKKLRKGAPVKGTTAKRTRASMATPKQAAPPFSPKVHLIEHAKVFAMAVKYHIDALQNLAAQKFKAEVEQHWDHEDLAHATHVIYTSTADEVTQLRKWLLRLWTHTASNSWQSPRSPHSCAASLGLLAICLCVIPAAPPDVVRPPQQAANFQCAATFLPSIDVPTAPRGSNVQPAAAIWSCVMHATFLTWIAQRVVRCCKI